MSRRKHKVGRVIGKQKSNRDWLLSPVAVQGGTIIRSLEGAIERDRLGLGAEPGVRYRSGWEGFGSMEGVEISPEMAADLDALASEMCPICNGEHGESGHIGLN